MHPKRKLSKYGLLLILLSAAFPAFLGAAFPPSPDGESSPSSLYPQTFMAASILLDAIPGEKLVALPTGFRRHLIGYRAALLATIPSDIDSFSSEKLLAKKPDLALTAPYSHPQMLARLKAYQIPILSLPLPTHPDQFYSHLKKLGEILGNSSSTHVLLESAEKIQDELFNLLKGTLNLLEKPPRVVFLDYSGHLNFFSKTLFWSFFIETFTINPKEERAFSFEWLTQAAADVIIVSAPPKVTSDILFYKHCKLLKNRQVYFVDQRLAHFPSHLQLLALYEFVVAYLKAITKT